MSDPAPTGADSASPVDGPPTEALREEHAQMLEGVRALGETARTVPRVSLEERENLLGANLKFLREVLLRHAEAEEEVLYPEWSRLTGYSDATAFLIADHREIEALVALLAEAPREEVGLLQQLLYSLEAMVGAHFRKEEELVFPALDEQRADLALQLLEQFRVAHGYAMPPPD